MSLTEFSGIGNVVTMSPVVGPIWIDFGPVKVYSDGRVERTDKFTTEEDAAKAFWQAVELFMPLKAK